jgi:ABC-2 type transport system permease protein
MKSFIGFVKKEWLHIFRDKRTLLILFGMPIVQVLIFGFGITNEIQNVDIAVLDNSRDEITRKITDKIISSGYYTLQKELKSNMEIEDEFRKGKIKLAIIFEDDFSRKFSYENNAEIQLLTDATDPNTANTIANYTASIINDFVREHNLTSPAPLNITTEIRMRYNEELKGAYLFVPGIITVLMMLISAMMTSISLTKEKELGTMEVILASPMKPKNVIIAKLLPYLLLSFILGIVILVIGVFIFGVPIRGNLMLLLAEMLLFILTSLALGILISTVSNTQQVALLISLVGLMLPTILLTGFIFPLENMPVWLQVIANIIPARWFMEIVRSIMLKGVGLELLWQETAILAGFTLFFAVLSIKKFKIRL